LPPDVAAAYLVEDTQDGRYLASFTLACSLSASSHLVTPISRRAFSRARKFASQPNSVPIRSQLANQSIMAPPTYADLGKQARDIFSRNYRQY